jgi:hypothetical protein
MKNIILGLALLVLVGCAGQQFLRPQNDTINIGKMSYQEIINNYGEPRRTGTIIQNNLTIKTISYSHAVAIPFTTKVSSKALVFSFHENLLVGYDYVSSFDEDKSEIELSEDITKKIKVGDSKSKAISLLGKPHGQFTFPLLEKKGSTSLRYTLFNSTRVPFLGLAQFESKTMSIILNEKDIITEIKFSETKRN